MNNNLGICIPTYKRPDQLRLCLDSVIAAAAPFNVPIFIADDSADSTNRDVLQDMRERYPLIFVSENKENLGIDRNILKSVNQCTSNYAWMLGEDDRLQKEAVQEVLALLERLDKGALPFIFVNYSSVDADVSHYLKTKVLAIEEDRTESAEHFFTTNSWAAGFLGGCIVNKKCWDEVDQNKYVGTYFAHIGTILEMVRSKTVYLVAKPLVLNRCGEPRLFTWTDSMFSVVAGWKEMTQLLHDVYPQPLCEKAAEQFEQAHGLYTLRFLCYARADYAYRLKHYHEYLAPLERGFPYNAMARLIAATPPPVFRTIRFFLTMYRRLVNLPVIGN